MRIRGKRQADLVKELGWAKGRANKFYHGQHDYRREIVNELADWLKIEPFELLMLPDEAMRLRRLRDAAFEVATGQVPPIAPGPPPAATPIARPQGRAARPAVPARPAPVRKAG